MPRQSLIDYLSEYPKHGRSTAFVQRSGYRTSRTSYAEVAGLAAQCAREFERLGIAPGDRILLWGRNSAEWVAAFFGCILRGAVAVPMDQGAAAEFAGRVAQQVDAKLLLCDHDNILKGTQRPVIVLDSLREAVAGHSRESYASPPLNRSSIAQILFTSGATAEPKGVVISHGNILANLEPLEAGIQPYLKWERFVHPLRFLDLVPLSHVFGQFMGVWIPPLLGGCVYFQESLNPSEIISTIRRERASVLISVPRVLEALQAKIERDLEAEGALETFRQDFDASEKETVLRRMWRFRKIHRLFGWKFWAVISGGATLDPALERFWGRTGFATIQGYGLTETTSLVSVNHPFRIGQGSIGKVLEGREVKLDESGEILVRGENIAAGYWEGNTIHAVAKNGADAGWFHTGDLGALDAEGNLYFKGRKKNVIVTAAGMNVFPEDLEKLLRREPEVKDCVVVGLERGGNAEPCGVLLLRDERRAKQPRHAAGIVARVNESLAEYQRMRSWFLWPETDFPRTSTGKPKLAEIRASVEAQWGNGNGAVNWPAATGGIGELISRMQGGGNKVDARSDLESDLHLSSLDRVELLSALEDRYQVDLNETRFASAKTVGELESLVRASSPVRSEFVFPRWAQRWPVTWIRTFFYYLLTWPATHLMAHPQRLRSRKSSRREGAGAGDFQSRDLPGRGICTGGAADAVAPSPSGGDGRRAPCRNAPAAPRMVLSAPLAEPHELFFGCLAVQCISAAQEIRRARKFSLCRGFGRSRMEHSCISRRRPDAGRKIAAIPLRHRPAGEQPETPRRANAHRRRVRNPRSGEQVQPPRPHPRLRRQACAISRGNRPAGDRASSRAMRRGIGRASGESRSSEGPGGGRIN